MFSYPTVSSLKKALDSLECSLPLDTDTSVLRVPLDVGNMHFHNRLVIQPMEGCDGKPDGAPDKLTLRRYERFAVSGAALIWVEATAISQDGRANPRQLWLHKNNLAAFQALVDGIKTDCLKANGFEPVVICQLTHSGRYAKPFGLPAPVIAYRNPLFEKDAPLPDSCVLSDGAIREIEQQYGAAAALCRQAGFDGADIKCCHRYLLNEFLSAYTRKGAYGGSFENRTRFLRNALQSARAATGGAFALTCRLNVYDGFPYPYGFGVSPNGGLQPDLSEPIKLIKTLYHSFGMSLLNITIGNPYVNPHVNRPADAGPYVPPEHPLQGVARMFDCLKELKTACPDICLVSSAHSYLRQHAGCLAAGAINGGYSDLAGFGREAFADPTFPRQLLSDGTLDANRCCVTCGKCTQLMRAGSVAGCVIRDRDVYLPLYKKYVREANV